MPAATKAETEKLGAGDSHVVYDVLDVQESVFEKLIEEVKWNVMHHRGGEVPRLVAVQGEVDKDDGSYPIYRHPADSSPPLLPFSPTVTIIRDHVQSIIGHPVNHVLIQHYRSGSDYISEHSDKTIDVVRGSTIVNVSLGAQRTMTLKMKKDGWLATGGASGEKRETQKFALPHNSMFVMGMETNQKWLHSIHHDKRPANLKSAEERAYDGHRISLTFRHIGTFLDKFEKKIWGQGARGKTKDEAEEVINGGQEAQNLIDAFGMENQRSDFVWEEWYGQGSNVLHFTEEQ